MRFEDIPTATEKELEEFLRRSKPDTLDESRIYDFAHKRHYDLKRERIKKEKTDGRAS